MQPRQLATLDLQMPFWLVIAACCISVPVCHAATSDPHSIAIQAFTNTVKPLIAHYCLQCHSTAKHKGDIDFEQFVDLDDMFKHSKPWERALDQLTHGDMPPPDKPQPTSDERHRLVAGLNAILDA